jgi:hypothetical protein
LRAYFGKSPNHSNEPGRVSDSTCHAEIMISGGIMKRFSVAFILLAVAAFILVSTPGMCEETKPVLHWYRLEIQTGDTTYQCIGSSAFEEQEFAKQLSGTEFIVLDDVAYIDTTGKIRDWQEWDPKALSRLYVNPQYVILFNPMKDDPKKAHPPKATKGK